MKFSDLSKNSEFKVGGPNPLKTKNDNDYIYSMDTDVRSEKKRLFRPIQQWPPSHGCHLHWNVIAARL